MDRRDANDQVRAALRDATYETLARSFRDSLEPVYQLRTAWFEPCTLAESHTVDGSLQSLTLAYGPWDTGQPHVRVTTWWDLLDQNIVDDIPAELAAVPLEDATVDIDGTPHPGALQRHPAGAWALRVDLGSHHLLASGRGPTTPLSFTPLTDLTQPIEARRTYLASRRG
ncbi:hypothetical protein [Actinacidiphila bryophytorum]|uniref:hypothetical protein n=1 Tax=Actinacidiphila bryophytorum TaxID=1436133 RepID=UPI002176D5A9|nr:hypothetical protein [Actinacidiphila bryophytorum]UWE07609.1 hypothetical protein NYE86_01895 [Actinacidiphila bryophytorum]